MINAIFDWLVDIIVFVLELLPASPFVYLTANEDVSKILGYLNYFLPIDFAISTLTAWLVAVGGFYAWSLVLRWIKAIE